MRIGALLGWLRGRRDRGGLQPFPDPAGLEAKYEALCAAVDALGLNVPELVMELSIESNRRLKLQALRGLRIHRDFARMNLGEKELQASNNWLDIICEPGAEMPLCYITPDMWEGVDGGDAGHHPQGFLFAGRRVGSHG